VAPTPLYLSELLPTQLGMWLTVTGVTLIIFSLINLYDIQKMEEKLKAAMAGTKPTQNPLLGLVGCFWGIWFIMGNVYFFFFNAETVFDNAVGATPSPGNSTDDHAKNCAALEAFGFTMLICLWVIPCVLTVCLQSITAQATMAMMQGGSPKETETVV
jgi:hypothetical protein